MTGIAHLTIYEDSTKHPGRFICLERVGDVPGKMTIRERRVNLQCGATLQDALAEYLQREGLTLMEDAKMVGKSLQAGVE
jgi:hypothetical protein